MRLLDLSFLIQQRLVSFYDETDNDPNARPPKTYPGKLTQLLYKRYQKFNGAADKGLILLPCELIADNGIGIKEVHHEVYRTLGS